MIDSDSDSGLNGIDSGIGIDSVESSTSLGTSSFLYTVWFLKILTHFFRFLLWC